MLIWQRQKQHRRQKGYRASGGADSDRPRYKGFDTYFLLMLLQLRVSNRGGRAGEPVSSRCCQLRRCWIIPAAASSAVILSYRVYFYPLHCTLTNEIGLMLLRGKRSNPSLHCRAARNFEYVRSI